MGRLRVILGHLWVIFGTFLGLFWVIFGSFLGHFWVFFGLSHNKFAFQPHLYTKKENKGVCVRGEGLICLDMRSSRGVQAGQRTRGCVPIEALTRPYLDPI